MANPPELTSVTRGRGCGPGTRARRNARRTLRQAVNRAQGCGSGDDGSDFNQQRTRLMLLRGGDRGASGTRCCSASCLFGLRRRGAYWGLRRLLILLRLLLIFRRSRSIGLIVRLRRLQRAFAGIGSRVLRSGSDVLILLLGRLRRGLRVRLIRRGGRGIGVVLLLLRGCSERGLAIGRWGRRRVLGLQQFRSATQGEAECRNQDARVPGAAHGSNLSAGEARWKFGPRWAPPSDAAKQNITSTPA